MGDVQYPRMAIPSGYARLRLVPSSVTGPHLDRLDVRVVLRLDEGTADQAALHDRGERLRPLPHGGTGLLGPLGHQRVEIVSGDHVAVPG
jgi:hypothetical protein